MTKRSSPPPARRPARSGRRRAAPAGVAAATRTAGGARKTVACGPTTNGPRLGSIWRSNAEPRRDRRVHWPPASASPPRQLETALSYETVRGVRRDRSRVVGFDELRSDLNSGQLPDFVWIAPGIRHDGHNSSLRTADRYASRLVPRVLHALGAHGILYLTWDEGSPHDRRGVNGPGAAGSPSSPRAAPPASTSGQPGALTTTRCCAPSRLDSACGRWATPAPARLRCCAG